MTVLSLPSSAGIARMMWELQRNDVMFGEQALSAADPLWRVSLEFSIELESNAGALKALLMRLRGGSNQLELYDRARPAPVGTMRGTMTLAAGVAVGATSLPITAGSGQAGKTLKSGDLIGIGTGTAQQIVMVTADAIANGSGVIAASIQPPLRNIFPAGQSVTWDKPKALFRRLSNEMGWDYRGKTPITSGIALELIEDTRS